MRETLVVRMEYKTWNDFKKDLESRLGRWMPVDLWLRTKPKKPLPWTEADLQTSISQVLKIQKSLNSNQNRFK